jgi:membrane protein DedA with SNARE-associated domain
MSRFRRQTCFLILAFGVSLMLTGCGSETTLMEKLETVESLPLWQRVTAIAVGTLVSEDMACIAAGLLAAEGVIPFGWALTGSFLGILIGDIGLYIIGRIGGLGMLRRPPFRWIIREHQILQAEQMFKEHGAKLIFSSRLLPGSRLPIYAAAGVLNYSPWRFCLFMTLAGGLSAIILVWGSRMLGDVVFEWLRIYKAYAVPFVVAVLLLAWIGVKLFEILATKRSRLVFLSRSRKLWQRIRGIRKKA